MDIAAWLRELGLERYEQAFLDNDITPAVLPELTDEDLRELGVSLGHRRLLLRAIKAPGEAEPSLARVPELHSSLSEPAPRPTAERRQLTVLFCDLVGSTGLSARLDPEDMSAVIRAYHACCTKVVERWCGQVAKYMGDGVLAYFGWPQAHEDDAERAVRAGLELAKAVGGQVASDGTSLAARIGIATGQVVVGELIGEGAAQEEVVVGETPNLAARLQGLAGPGEVVIAASTRRLVGGVFELCDLGPQRLKGFAEPLVAWRIEREAAAESRFEATRGRQFTPLVGRAHELGLLLDRWCRAKDGEGQVVLLSGEAGIGKSRLIQALRECVHDEPHTPLPHYGSAHHTSSAFHPIVHHLERAAGFARDDSPALRLDKLEALLRPSSHDLAGATRLIAPLLGVDPGERYGLLDLTPQRRKQLTLEVLVEQVEGLERQRPVLAIYEDVHWFDPTTLEVLGGLIDRISGLRVLVLIAFRPDFTPPWPAHGHVTALSLSRLARREGAELMARVAGGRALPQEVEAELLARTDGIPLFIEELTKVVLESGLLDEVGDGHALRGPLPQVAIPSSLHDSLMARLDRLAPIKEVAQIASVIGREFPHRLLSEIAGRSDSEISAALAQLEAAELIWRRGLGLDATYTFKHALVQDAAYQSLLKSRRQQLHARIAAAIERRQPMRAQQEPELLAHHLTQTGDAERAISYWRAAGQLASERSAFHEAVAHLATCVRLLRELPETESRDRTEMQVQISLGSASVVIHSYASAAAEIAYGRARELAQKLDEPAHLFTATWGLWLINQTRVHVKAGRALADELLAVAERGTDLGRQLEAHHSAWTTLLCVPDLAACCRHTEQGLAIYDPDQHIAHKFQYGGHDPGVCGLQTRGVALWLFGYPEQALNTVGEAMCLARDLGHGPSLVVALSLSSYLHRFRGEIEPVREKCEEQIRLCAEQGIAPQHAAWARLGRGWAMAQAGELEPGLVEMREGVSQLEALEMRFRRAYHLAMFAEVCMTAGRLDECRAALTEALESAERWWEPEAHRLRGALALAAAAGAGQEAEHHFQRALSVAQSQQSRSLELRAATSLARLWCDQGKRAEAHDLLAPVYGWFTEGFDTADLKDAKALLDELH